MHRALELAARRRGDVEPNPMVGCVLLKEGRVIGEGAHERFGRAHAERNAIAAAQAAGEDPAGATAVVTLEPCSHTGKQPPCTDALIGAGIARVVAAMEDPDPRVAGSGFVQLRDRGVACEVGLLEAEARELNAPFIRRVNTGLPWLILKWAQTLDGRIATRTGHSRWISNAESRRDVHRLRARCDAVLTGVGTVLADDPALTVRLPEGEQRDWHRRHPEPLRVVLDRTGRTPADAAMLHDGGPPVRVFRGKPGEALRALAADGATNVLAECGPTLATALLDAGLVCELHVYLAPTLMTDTDARPALLTRATPPGPPLAMADARGLRLIDTTRLGDDVRLRYRLPARA